MRTGASTVSPRWPEPNYSDPVRRGLGFLIFELVCTIIVVFVVALRVYARRLVRNWFGADDYCILAATFTSFGLAITSAIAFRQYGFDRHIWDVPPDVAETSGNIVVANVTFLALSLFLIRVSLLLLYYRLTLASDIRWFIGILNWNLFMQFVIVTMFLTLSTALFCRDMFSISALADDGTHAKIASAAWTSTGANLIADLVVSLLPVPVVVRLNIPLSQRLGIMVLLGLGLLVSFAGGLKAFFIWKAFYHTRDVTWHSYELFICANTEVHLGIVCACAPALWPLFKRRSFRLFGKA